MWIIVVAVGCAAFGYMRYVRSRVTDALARTPLNITYADIDSWYPGRVSLYGLTLEPSGATPQRWTLSLERAKLHYDPWLGIRDAADRTITIEVPEQTASLQAATLHGLLELHGRATLDALQPAHLSRAELFASSQSLHLAGKRVSPLDLQLSLKGTDSANVVRGTVAASGDHAQPLFAALNAESALQWVLPQALSAPFKLDSKLELSHARVDLRDLHASCGRLALQGGLRWRLSGIRGALLVTSPLRVGLRLNSEGGQSAQTTLSPDADWLERTLGATLQTQAMQAPASAASVARAQTRAP